MKIFPHTQWDIEQVLQWVFEPLFRVYVYLLVLLPSGSLFGFNIKTTVFLLLLVPALLRLFQKRSVTFLHVGLLIALPAVFAVWLLIGQIYGVDLFLSLSQYKDVLTTFVSVWLAAVYFSESELAKVKFLLMMIHAEGTACVAKLLLLAYVAYKGIPISVLVDTISDFTGTNLMGMDSGEALGRIQFIADGLIPLCIYVLLRYRKKMGITTTGALVLFVLLVTSLVFTFSRFFWAFAGLALCLGLLSNRKDRFHAWVLVLLSMIFLSTFPLLSALAQLRFSADVAGGSDEIRTVQMAALMHFFLSAPLFGHGFGSYPTDVIRNSKLPYVYEIQLLALAGQEGIVGISLMGCLGLYYFNDFLPWHRGEARKLG